MIVSHAWVRAFVPHDHSAAEIGELLSRHTVTLDGLVPLREDLAAFVVARVVEAAPHPDSDHLSVTKVDDGSGELVDVVCGAPNVQAGTKYPFARVGTTMPGGLVIAKRKIRGHTSAGMLCSARELGLGDDHDGILALDTDAAPGTPLLDVLEAGDVALDLDVLPNRPDLLSHLGVAREVSALTGVPLRMPPELPLEPSDEGLGVVVRGDTEAEADGVRVRIDDTAACPRYLALVIRGVSVGPSPAWLVERLAAIGARSINNVVDATNWVLHGLGQPVHAFDLAALAGDAIVVRQTRAGESLVTLDGVERTLAEGTTVICDGERPTALAGVMGGQASEVTERTTDVLLEVANFAPRFVRGVRRAVQLSTDASYRFERGIDAGFTPTAARLAAGLIAAVAGGRITACLDVGREPAAPAPVCVRGTRVRALLGAAVDDATIVAKLEAVGATVAPLEGKTGTWSVQPPTWRHDLGLEEDAIEEVARLVGFDTLPDTLRPARPSAAPDDPLVVASRRVREVCLAWGLLEARPMPFVREGAPQLRVRNPLAEDEPFLRDSVLATLAGRAEYNLSRMQGNVRLFEIGTAFVATDDRLPREDWRVAALIMGASRPPHFTEPEPPPYDAWDAKALGEALAQAAFPQAAVVCVPRDDAVGWSVHADDAPIGTIGPVVLDRPAWAAEAWGIELTLGVVASADVAPAGEHAHGAPPVRPPSRWARVRYAPLPVTPASSFDLALLVPAALPAGDVETLLRREGGALLERIELFDRYEGTGVPAGMRSLAWRLTWRHPERTLRDKEIEGRRAKLLSTLERELGVRPRTG